MGDRFINWLLFLLLSVIWGSSFILIKIGLQTLSPYQVATIRILTASLSLSPFALNAWKKIPKNKIGYVILSGVMGSFFPAYLFCIAELRIDSSITAIINSLTPLLTIAIGVIFFKVPTTIQKIAGVILGFIGLCLLPFASAKGLNLKDISYAFFIFMATMLYGINVNMVSRHLKELGALQTASISFIFLIIPCMIILYSTGYTKNDFSDKHIILSSIAASVLGVFGTAVASVLFYMLVKKAGAIFGSLVTYGIPFIAVIWGILYGEKINALQIGCLGIILSGVYFVNKKTRYSPRTNVTSLLKQVVSKMMKLFEN